MCVARKRRKGRLPAQPVIGRSLSTGDEYYFSSMREAAEHGFQVKEIGGCLNGKYKQTGGFEWRKWE